MTDFKYEVGDNVFTISDDSQEEFLLLYPDAIKVFESRQEALPMPLADPEGKEENKYKFYVKDADTGVETAKSYTEFRVNASDLEEFEKLYPQHSYQPFQYNYEVDDEAFYSEPFYTESAMGLGERGIKGLVSELLPMPTDPGVPPARTATEKGVDFFSRGVGFGYSLTPWKLAVGGVKPTIKKGSKEANKALLEIAEAGTAAEMETLSKEAVRKGVFTSADEITEALVPLTSGLLGKSEKYARFVSWLAAKSPKSARYLDDFTSHFLTFGLHGQAKSHLPLDFEIETLSDRGKQFMNDGVMGAVFSFASIPKTLEWNKLAQNSITPAALFGIGYAGGDFLPYSLYGQEEEMDSMDRLAHGLGMVTFYYAGKGLDKYNIQKKQLNALEAVGITGKDATKLLKAIEGATESAEGITMPVRPREQQNLFDGKGSGKYKGQQVDLLTIETGEGVPKARYKDLKTEKEQVVPLKQFRKNFHKSEKLINDEIYNVHHAYNRSTKKWQVIKYDKRGKQLGEAEIMENKVSAVDRSKALQTTIEINKTEHRRAQKLAKVQEGNLTLSPKDAEYIKKALFPESEGSTVNMTAEEMYDYNKTLRHSLATAEIPRPSLNALEGAGDKKGILRVFDQVNRGIILDPIGYLKFINKHYPIAKDISRKLIDYRNTHDLVLGSFTNLKLELEDLGFKAKDVDALFGILDPHFKDFVPENMKNNPNAKIAAELIQTVHTQMADMGVESGLQVAVIRGGQKTFEPLWSAIGTDGKPLQLDLQVMRAKKMTKGYQFLKEGDSVITKDGKSTKIKKILYNHIQDNFVHRIVTPEAKVLFNKNLEYQSLVINRMIKNDPEAASMSKTYRVEMAKAEKIQNKSKREVKKKEIKGLYGAAAIKQKMIDRYSEVSGWIDDLSIYGAQYSRHKLDVPPEIALNKAGKIIPLDKYNTYKKGDIVGKEKIHRIVQVYDTRTSHVLGRYANKWASVIAANATYGTGAIDLSGKVKGTPSVKGEIAQGLLNRLELESGSKELRNYVESVMKEQVYGSTLDNELAGRGVSIFNNAIGAVSNAALSLPTSGLKNLMIGQGMNASVFGVETTYRALKDLLANGESAQAMKKFAAQTGALEAGTRLIEIQALVKGNPGLMYITEYINRITAATAGKVAAETALAVHLGNESFLTSRMSKSQARHLLYETFDLKNMNEIIERGYFEKNELIQIGQIAHRTTQGQPTVEYMPRAYQAKIMRPMTLFHRMAYRAGRAVYDNAVKPAMADGNVWPMVKWAGAAYMTGATRNWLYYLMTGAPQRDMYETPPMQIINTMVDGELLGPVGNLIQGVGYTPAVLDYMGNTAELLAYYGLHALGEPMLGALGDLTELEMPSFDTKQYKELESFLDTVEGPRGKPLSDKDKKRILSNARNIHWQNMWSEGTNFLEESIPLWNMITDGWARTSEPYKERNKYVKKLQNIYAESTGKDDMYRPEYDTYNPNTEFFNEMRDVFWAGSDIDKMRMYEASVMSIAHNILLSPGSAGSLTKQNALKEAIGRVDKSILSTSPTYQSSKETFKLGIPMHKSKYQVFINHLKKVSPDDVQIVIDAQKDWDIRKDLWNKTIHDVKHNILRYGQNKDYQKHYSKEDDKPAYDRMSYPSSYEAEGEFNMFPPIPRELEQLGWPPSPDNPTNIRGVRQ